MADNLEKIRELFDDLPEDALATSAIVILAYYTSDSDSLYVVLQSGETDHANIVGLLTMTAHHFMLKAEEE